MNDRQAIKKIIQICESNTFIEVCGFLGYRADTDDFLVEEQENISEDPANYFLISPVNYLLFKDKVDEVIVFHSHISSNEKPSEFDIKVSESCCDSFLIYSVISKKINIYNPQYGKLDVSIARRLRQAI